VDIVFKPTKVQHQAWQYLVDKKTNHILYGGSAGSGKSFLGCMWIFLSALQYKETRYLIGRARLNNLKKTTLKTFLDICKKFNYTDFNLNHASNTITMGNGSEIVLADLYNYPNDPDYDRLGSSEYTAIFVDELSEISYKGFQVLTSRIRYKLTEYDLIPKLFCASNPYQGWSKNYFYLPYVENRETEHVKFVPALPTDNQYLPASYLETMSRTLDHALKQRLLYGDWSFDADEYNLFEYDKIQQCFYNETFVNTNLNMYLTVDVGDLGNDKTVIALWRGWNCIKLVKLEKNETTQVVAKINELRIEYKIPITNIIIDSVGVGAGVASLLKGCVRYMGSNKPINTGFRNIKTELMYKFAEKINNLDLNFNFSYDDSLIQQLLLYKKEFTNLIAGITTKDRIKQALGKSPDTADALYLRAYWEVGVPKQSIIRVL
jgi:PBSX family phage terminase large subunit